jgi:hypothetical protein
MQNRAPESTAVFSVATIIFPPPNETLISSVPFLHHHHFSENENQPHFFDPIFLTSSPDYDRANAILSRNFSSTSAAVAPGNCRRIPSRATSQDISCSSNAIPNRCSPVIPQYISICFSNPCSAVILLLCAPPYFRQAQAAH